MIRFFNVELLYVAVVEADSYAEARDTALEYARRAVQDADEPTVTVTHEIQCVADFRDGWDGECLAYGGDGNSRIGELDPRLSWPNEERSRG